MPVMDIAWQRSELPDGSVRAAGMHLARRIEITTGVFESDGTWQRDGDGAKVWDFHADTRVVVRDITGKAIRDETFRDLHFADGVEMAVRAVEAAAGLKSAPKKPPKPWTDPPKPPKRKFVNKNGHQYASVNWEDIRRQARERAKAYKGG